MWQRDPIQHSLVQTVLGILPLMDKNHKIPNSAQWRQRWQLVSKLREVDFVFSLGYMLDLSLFADCSIVKENNSTEEQNKMLKTYEEWV